MYKSLVHILALATNLSWPGKSQKLEMEREEMPCLKVYRSRGNVCSWHSEVVQDELAMDLFIKSQVGFDIQYQQEREKKKATPRNCGNGLQDMTWSLQLFIPSSSFCRGTCRQSILNVVLSGDTWWLVT